jgi:ureidoacrylate peracid hydrolase
MNGLEIPDDITARVMARCGVAHPHADLDPKRTALVVIDLQNAFMDDAIGHAVCPAARDIVPEVNRLAATVRATGGGVFWIKNTWDERTALEWSSMENMLSPAARARRIEAMREGGKGHDLWPELDVRPEDEIVRKYRFSAFLPGTSELPYRLRARFRYGADHRNGHQCLLRVIGPGRDDVEFPDGDDHRWQRGDEPAGA